MRRLCIALSMSASVCLGAELSAQVPGRCQTPTPIRVGYPNMGAGTQAGPKFTVPVYPGFDIRSKLPIYNPYSRQPNLKPQTLPYNPYAGFNQKPVANGRTPTIPPGPRIAGNNALPKQGKSSTVNVPKPNANGGRGIVGNGMNQPFNQVRPGGANPFGNGPVGNFGARPGGVVAFPQVGGVNNPAAPNNVDPGNSIPNTERPNVTINYTNSPSLTINQASPTPAADPAPAPAVPAEPVAAEPRAPRKPRQEDFDEDVDEDAANRVVGMKVKRMVDGGPAQKSQLRLGDVILCAAGYRVKTRDEFIRAIADADGPIEIIFVNVQTRKIEKLILKPVEGKIGLYTAPSSVVHQ